MCNEKDNELSDSLMRVMTSNTTQYGGRTLYHEPNGEVVVAGVKFENETEAKKAIDDILISWNKSINR